MAFSQSERQLAVAVWKMSKLTGRLAQRIARDWKLMRRIMMILAEAHAEWVVEQARQTPGRVGEAARQAPGIAAGAAARGAGTVLDASNAVGRRAGDAARNLNRQLQQELVAAWNRRPGWMR